MISLITMSRIALTGSHPFGTYRNCYGFSLRAFTISAWTTSEWYPIFAAFLYHFSSSPVNDVPALGRLLPV